jgi:hypothetical protein
LKFLPSSWSTYIIRSRNVGGDVGHPNSELHHYRNESFKANRQNNGPFEFSSFRSSVFFSFSPPNAESPTPNPPWRRSSTSRRTRAASSPVRSTVPGRTSWGLLRRWCVVLKERDRASRTCIRFRWRDDCSVLLLVAQPYTCSRIPSSKVQDGYRLPDQQSVRKTHP